MVAAQLLLVEDDNAMREMLESLFRQEGYIVSEAASANAALDLARETDFDVVLSDIKMPGKSGLELVGELRQLRPDTPVVLMTAFGSIDTAVDAMRAGAFGYTTKPFQPEGSMPMGALLSWPMMPCSSESASSELNRACKRKVSPTPPTRAMTGVL